eukprot:gene11404-17551_t
MSSQEKEMLLHVKRKRVDAAPERMVLEKKRKLTVGDLTARMENLGKPAEEQKGARVFRLSRSVHAETHEAIDPALRKRKRAGADDAEAQAVTYKSKVTKTSKTACVYMEAVYVERTPTEQPAVPEKYRDLLREAYPEQEEEDDYVIDQYVMETDADRTESTSGIPDERSLFAESGMDSGGLDRFEIDWDFEEWLDHVDGEQPRKKVTWKDDDGEEDFEDEEHPRFDYPDKIKRAKDDDRSTSDESEASSESMGDAEALIRPRYTNLPGESSLIADCDPEAFATAAYSTLPPDDGDFEFDPAEYHPFDFGDGMDHFDRHDFYARREPSPACPTSSSRPDYNEYAFDSDDLTETSESDAGMDPVDS